MKRMLLLSNALLLIAGLAFSGPVPTSDDDRVITVLSPGIAGKLAERIPLLPRLNTLEGKTLYMVDVQWGGPDAAFSVFEEMQAWFAKNMPTVKTVLRRTKGNIFSDDPALWKEIGQKGNAAIVGIAG